MHRSHSNRFGTNKEGSVLIEFAFAAPVLIILLLGIIETSRYMIFREKLDTTATQMLDIITQNKNVSSTSLDNLFSAFPYMMEPYNSAPPYIIVTQIVSPVPAVPGQTCKPVALWQYHTNNGTAHASRIAQAGTAADMREIELELADNAMTIEVFAVYTPLLANKFTAGIFGDRNLYTFTYGHTRYSTFNRDPGTGKPVKAKCIP